MHKIQEVQDMHKIQEVQEIQKTKHIQEIQKTQQILSKISCEIRNDLPCIPEPCMIRDESGKIVKLITANSQLHVYENQKDMETVWGPSFYQDCMKPEVKVIHSLSIHVLDGNRLQLKIKYNEVVVDLANVEIEVSIWKPGMERHDCRNCKNCGRC